MNVTVSLNHQNRTWNASFLVGGALGIYWFVMFVMTHLPPEMLLRGISSADELMADGGDKLLHFAAYAGLTFLFACWLWTRGTDNRRVTYLSLIAPGLYAVLDELLQIPVRRMADIMDCCADWAGVLAGFACFLLAKNLVRQFGGDASSAEA